jgi:hypothetical protein
MFLPRLNAAIGELDCRQAVMPNITVHGRRNALRRVHLAECGANCERSGVRLFAGAPRNGCASGGTIATQPAVGNVDKLCESKTAKRSEDCDWHNPRTFAAAISAVSGFRHAIAHWSSAIGLGRRGRCTARTRWGARSASILAGRVRTGRQLSKESVLGRECAVGHVDLLHALLGMRALWAVGRKAVRVELLDEPSVTSLHGAPVVSAGTEAKGPIPEGDVAIGHGSDADAPLIGKRTDRALRVSCNVICDSGRNLTRGVGMSTASRARHVGAQQCMSVGRSLSTLPSSRRGAGTEPAEGQSDVMRVIQLKSVSSDAYNDFSYLNNHI